MTNKEINRRIIDIWVEGKISFDEAYAMLREEEKEDVILDAIVI